MTRARSLDELDRVREMLALRDQQVLEALEGMKRLRGALSTIAYADVRGLDRGGFDAAGWLQKQARTALAQPGPAGPDQPAHAETTARFTGPTGQLERQCRCGQTWPCPAQPEGRE